MSDKIVVGKAVFEGCRVSLFQVPEGGVFMSVMWENAVIAECGVCLVGGELTLAVRRPGADEEAWPLLRERS